MLECDDYFCGLSEEEYEEETREHFLWLENHAIKIPKEIARIKLCGGGLIFTITDNMKFEMPTKEQCENLKKTFGIEVELIKKDKEI